VYGGPVSGPPYTAEDLNNPSAAPQDLGVLFPHELQGNGVAVTRLPSEGPSLAPPTTADTYRFQVLQAQNYFFLLGDGNLPQGVRLTLTDVRGKAVVTRRQADGVSLLAFLQPGTYLVRVGSWTAAQAPGIGYTLRIVLGASPENPPPLTLGPAPVLSLRVAGSPPPPAPTPAPTPTVGPIGPALPPTRPARSAGDGTPPPSAGPSSPSGSPRVSTPVSTTSAAGSASTPDPGPVVEPQVAERVIRLPDNLLVVLGAEPVGGVARTGTAGGQPNVPLLSLADLSRTAPDAVVRLVVFDASKPADGGGGPRGDGTAWAESPSLLGLTRTVANRLGFVWQWLEQLLRQTCPTTGPTDDGVDDDLEPGLPEAENLTRDSAANDLALGDEPPAATPCRFASWGALGPIALGLGLGLGPVLTRAWRRERSETRGKPHLHFDSRRPAGATEEEA
jgi:hypothetical protein